MKSEARRKRIQELFLKWSALVGYRTQTGKPVKQKMKEARKLSMEIRRELKYWKRENKEDMRNI